MNQHIDLNLLYDLFKLRALNEQILKELEDLKNSIRRVNGAGET